MHNLERISYRAIEMLFNCLGRIPRKSAGRIADFVGRLIFLVDKKHRRIAIDNLRYAWGHQKSSYEIRTLARQVFINLVKVVLEIGWSLNLDEKELVQYFKIEGLTGFKKVYEKGKGVLILTAHFGNWELLTVIGIMGGYPLSIVYRPLDFKPLDRFFINLRTRFGGKVIPKRRALREILRSLNRGELVALLMDQNVDWYEGVFVDFMGHRACTNSGLALLALKTGAPVVPVFLVRETDGFTAKVLPEIPFDKTGDKIRDLEHNTQKYNKAIESFLRQYPDQWFWLHQRWKTKSYQPWPKTDK